jgi:hypothetical protein
MVTSPSRLRKMPGGRPGMGMGYRLVNFRIQFTKDNYIMHLAQFVNDIHKYS